VEGILPRVEGNLQACEWDCGLGAVHKEGCAAVHKEGCAAKEIAHGVAERQRGRGVHKEGCAAKGIAHGVAGRQRGRGGAVTEVKFQHQGRARAGASNQLVLEQPDYSPVCAASLKHPLGGRTRAVKP
jgi:hypothetical protein